ncbi:hypothetical protein ALI144C_44810 [Actinosynnema sp. ALI-1.44]|uniref:phage tail tape measure protein n=1 Tax=Actinosynnema sp. ALI-1.44 TaxID=1933779 RepID=UPI00097C976E|nr:phage tail tape measure protein [Actinosynnema sp. ALI-1.44]ONI73076.1 hypothetical protein ALI144C_44810 [Actinosynnema sp. ALI-1.44]
MADPSVKLTFAGDEKKLTAAAQRAARAVDDMSNDVKSSSGAMASALSGDAAKAEKAFAGAAAGADKLSQAVNQVKGEKINVTADADVSKAEAAIKGIDKKDKIRIAVEADTGKAEAAIKDVGKDASAQAGSAAGKSFGGKFAGALAAIPIAGILSNALEAGASEAKLTTKLQNQMGLSPADAQKYGASVGKAYASGLGDSKDQIASVYATLSSDVKGWAQMTKAAQDDVAARMVKVVQGFGVDVPEAIRAASSAVTNRLVPDWTAAQDLLVAGYQTLGSRGEDWADTLQEYSGYFHNLGFDGATALGVIQQGLQAGARDTDYIADAFKELNIRVIDGSKEVGQALQNLGLDAQAIPQAIARGGPGALVAVDSIITRIKEIKDPVEQNRIGVALFGTQWEDTMKQVVSAIDVNMARAQTQYTGAVNKMAVSTDTEMDKLSRRMEEGASKLGGWMAARLNELGSFLDNWDPFAGIAPKAQGAIDVFDKVADAVGQLQRQVEIDIKVQAEWEKVHDIHERLRTLPPNTPVKVQGLTQEAEDNLNRLGYQVTHLPGGWVSVQANTQYAIDQANRTVAWLNSLYATIRVGVVGTPQNLPLKSKNGGMVSFATGGWVGGVGSGTSDSNPIWASKGEHITAEKHASKPENARILDAINAGKDWRAAVGYRASGYMPSSTGPTAVQVAVSFAGGTDSALATVIQKLIRGGQIQIKAA